MGKILKFNYVNHRGECSLRTVKPICIKFGSTLYYNETWLLEAYDIDKKEHREFKLDLCEFINNSN